MEGIVLIKVQEVKPLGIEVTEIVTGFVQSNILHHGLYAPEDSIYLPLKGTIEKIKYQGNANGMPANAYAASIVDKLMRRRAGTEIWEGGMARMLRLVFLLLPSRLLVSRLLVCELFKALTNLRRMCSCTANSSWSL